MLTQSFAFVILLSVFATPSLATTVKTGTGGGVPPDNCVMADSHTYHCFVPVCHKDAAGRKVCTTRTVSVPIT